MLFPQIRRHTHGAAISGADETRGDAGLGGFHGADDFALGGGECDRTRFRDDVPRLVDEFGVYEDQVSRDWRHPFVADNGVAPAAGLTVSAASVDLLGAPRLYGKIIDMGCFELQSGGGTMVILW